MVVLALLLGLLLAGCSEPEGFAWGTPQPPGEPDILREDLRLDLVGSGYQRPVAVLPVPGADASVVVEQVGSVRMLVADGANATVVADLTDRVGTCHHEQGLLGFAFDPAFPVVPRVVLAYTDRPCEVVEDTDWHRGDLVLSSFPATLGEAGDLRVLVDQETVLYRLEQPHRNHNGGHVLFGPDGHLYLGVGDGGSHGDPDGRGQDPKDPHGTILRFVIDADGAASIPPDNPFADGVDGAPEVYVYGLRNPWRFDFDDATGDLWVADVGQNEIEEVNLLPHGQQGGANLGWRLYEGSVPFAEDAGDADGAGLVMPLHEYTHQPEGHCSVTGGPFLDAASLPALEDHYLFADFCSGFLWAVDAQAQVQVLGATGLQVTGFGADHEGRVMITHWGGTVHALVPQGDV